MKLYHVTPIKNKNKILKNGLNPSTTKAWSALSNNDRLLQKGVFGFTSIKNALEFGKDQCWNKGLVIFEFESNNIILDPEYENNESYFMPAKKNITGIKIVQEIEF